MKRNLSIALVTSLLSALLLYLWRLSYAFSDLAILWLLLLAAMIFFGNWSLVIDHWLVERGVVLRPESWLSRLLSGRILALFSSVLLVGALVPYLAWQALTMSAVEAAALLGLVLLTAWLFLWAKGFVGRHFMPPFDRIIASGAAAWLIGLPFAIVLFLVSWRTASVPISMLNASFFGAVQSGFDALPERRGWIAEVLAFGYAFEAAKLWLVVQLRDYPVAALLFNLDSALFGFLVARAGVVITNFIDTYYDRKA